MTLGSRLTAAGSPSAIFSPWSRTTMWFEMRMTIFMSCSTSRMAMPEAATSAIRWSISSVSTALQPAAGSSRRRTRGFSASARAISSRFSAP